MDRRPNGFQDQSVFDVQCRAVQSVARFQMTFEAEPSCLTLFLFFLGVILVIKRLSNTILVYKVVVMIFYSFLHNCPRTLTILEQDINYKFLVGI